MQHSAWSERFPKKLIMRALIVSLLLTLPFWVHSQNPCNCCADDFRQFDFWVGSWNAYDSTGTLLGTNVIDIIQDSCVIRENWKSARSAYTGTSYNFYNPSSMQWTQTWVDNQGGSLLLHGGIVDGSMQLSSAPVNDNQGREVVNRITWTPLPDGSVRQHWETRTDGAQWVSVFDGNYRRQ